MKTVLCLTACFCLLFSVVGAEEAPNYSKEIAELRTENKLLKSQVETLNSANDKILNSVYWSIGIVLTTLIGLSVWNSLKAQQLNDEKFKEHLQTTKSELLTAVNDQIADKIKSVSFSDLSAIKSDIRSLDYDFIQFQLGYAITNFKYHPYYRYYGGSTEGDALLRLIELVVRSKDTSNYSPTLQAIINFLKSDEYLDFTEKNKLLEYLDKSFNNPNYGYQVDEIKKLLADRSN